MINFWGIKWKIWKKVKRIIRMFLGQKVSKIIKKRSRRKMMKMRTVVIRIAKKISLCPIKLKAKRRPKKGRKRFRR